MIGFFSGTWGTIGAICGILACIASSMLMCCAPKTVDRGSCKFTAVRIRAHTRLHSHRNSDHTLGTR